MKILFLCTGGNSCRSLMAEAFLQKLDKSLEVFSAGLHPDENTDPMAVEVMKEIGIDISTKKPKSYHEFEGMEFDYLITLCDGTKDKIDTVQIPTKHHMHLGFEDPHKAFCPEEQLIYLYQDIRNEIRNELDYFYVHVLINELKSK
jgi:arsenate reductase (thioredoxin)